MFAACGTKTADNENISSETTNSVSTENHELNIVTHAAEQQVMETTTEVHEEATLESVNEESTVENEEQPYITMYYQEQDIVDVAKVLQRECGGVPSKTEQACVAWCVLNRVDATGDSIYNVVRAPHQFAFSESTVAEDTIVDLARDVLLRWNNEKNGLENVGRVLPKEYTYFHGDGVHNYFRNSYDGNYDVWDYSYESPYEN